ncbi:Aste57867_25275 [Aphanomyces stellatus]|uniref:Aste57867_25275 protein n=1 Tax=Aphanomyces stellatus TaxID=120398 RepID=A0A485LSP4_9STRA|nr:hypothetical protein As57867_025197 [Aphanomyces stellatus]VFU01901.1 Aste57867_25275 [Aphanomyces stellatus]
MGQTRLEGKPRRQDPSSGEESTVTAPPRTTMERMGCTGCDRMIQLKPVFQRNNKDKKKNIRCFPHCCPARGGHKSSGFCGSSVYVLTDRVCDVVVCRYESDANDPSTTIVVGHSYDRSFVDRAIMCPAVSAGVEMGLNRFVLNPDVNKKGWSYPYDTRIEKNRQHRLSVYLMQSTDTPASQQATCVDEVHSAWFTMRSTRMPKRSVADEDDMLPRESAMWSKPRLASVVSVMHSAAKQRRRLHGATPSRPSTPLTAQRHPTDNKWAVFNPMWHIR